LPVSKETKLRKALVVVLSLVILSAIASGQTRRKSSRSTRATRAAAAKVQAEVQAGRRQVASQIKTLTQFLYLFGGVVRGFESVEQASRADGPSPTAAAMTERNRVKVKASLRNLRDGLDQLELKFRSTPSLSQYYPYLSGVAIRAETAENQAVQSRFDEAGKSLLKAVDQLADALAAMR
jgi:hypothetical protein